MFVMSGRPTHHPDAFLSELFRKPDSFGYITKSRRSRRTGVPPVNNAKKIPLVPSIPLRFRFAKMFVMSWRPTHHPDAFLSESFRKPDSFGYSTGTLAGLFPVTESDDRRANPVGYES